MVQDERSEKRILRGHCCDSVIPARPSKKSGGWPPSPSIRSAALRRHREDADLRATGALTSRLEDGRAGEWRARCSGSQGEGLVCHWVTALGSLNPGSKTLSLGGGRGGTIGFPTCQPQATPCDEPAWGLLRRGPKGCPRKVNGPLQKEPRK